MMREAIAFMLRPITEKSKSNPLKDGTALAYVERQCKLFEAFDMESAMCKAMCSVTIIQVITYMLIILSCIYINTSIYSLYLFKKILHILIIYAHICTVEHERHCQR